MSRDELIVVVRSQAGQLIVRDRQISEMAGQLARLMEANEALAGKLAKLEHLLSRNLGNSSNPPSKDDDPGKPAPPDKDKRGQGAPTRLSTFSYLDMTALGRQEEWENTPRVAPKTRRTSGGTGTTNTAAPSRRRVAGLSRRR